MSASEFDHAQAAEDRAEGLAALAEAERDADPERQAAQAGADEGHRFDRRRAARALAGLDLRAERENARLARLRDVATPGAFSTDAAPTINAVTIVAAHTDSLAAALDAFNRMAEREPSLRPKAALGRDLLRRIYG